MYFPYLRGRQNELLCIKELLENGKIRKTRYENYKKFIESIEELKR